MTEQAQEPNTSDVTVNTEKAQDAKETPEIYRSQEDFDRAFARKLEKEREKLRKELAAEAEAAKKKAAMDEAERLKVEMEERDAKASEREKAANNRAIRSEAKVQALEAGAKPERVTALLRLSDLSDIEVDDDGEPDAKAVKKAIEAALKEYPEFKVSRSLLADGFSPTGGAETGEKNPWSKEHFNLSEQGRILTTNPELAKKLQKAAS